MAIVIASLIGALASYFASRPRQEQRADDIADLRRVVDEQTRHVQTLAEAARQKDDLIAQLRSQPRVTVLPADSTQAPVLSKILPDRPPITEVSTATTAAAGSPPAVVKVNEAVRDAAESTRPERPATQSESAGEPTRGTDATVGLARDAEVTVPRAIKAKREDREVRTLSVAANAEWFRSEVTVHADDDIEISASGSVKTASYSVTSGPEGQRYMCDTSDCVARSQPFAILLGRVGGDRAFVIGAVHAFRASRTGELRFAVNDKSGNYGDNRGSFDVKVVIQHRCD